MIEVAAKKMHSSECPGQTAPARATGSDLLLQLGRLIVSSRNESPPPDRHTPSTSEQIQTQPQPRCDDEEDATLEHQLTSHVTALWTEQIPVCIEVLLAPECQECHKNLFRVESDKQHQQRGLLLERWTMHALLTKSEDTPMFINSQWLVNAVRSQLHFSQLSAWRARIHAARDEPPPIRRKLSREQCNYKKIEANSGQTDGQTDRKLNIVYSIKIPSETYKTEFSKNPTNHIFPLTDIGNNVFLKIVLHSLPRLDDIPSIKCSCQKRRASKEIPSNSHEELVGKLNDLSLDSRNGAEIRLNDDTVVDDRMLTPCSENGKHKCNCDEESDSKEKSDKNQPKKLDERRLKEIAKYKRRLRKEKMRKLCESTSSEGDTLKIKETTSIPILQASRFDRFRAIGCYRNQTYLTLPASRIETKSPFIETDLIPAPEFKKTNTIGTQTDFTCPCGNILEIKCEECCRGMVRSDANYNLAGLSDTNGARRKLDDPGEDKSLKKHKCDSSSLNCDNVNKDNKDLIKRPKFKRFFPIVERLEKIVSDRNKEDIKDLHLKTDDSVFSVPDETKRDVFSIPKTKRDTVFSVPSETKRETVFAVPNETKRDAFSNSKDSIFLLNESKRDSVSVPETKGDNSVFPIPNETNDSVISTPKETKRQDTVFSVPKESKRQKTYSISDDDYVLYEKCDYGTIDRHDLDSPKELQTDFKFALPENNDENDSFKNGENLECFKNDFVFNDPKNQVPSPSEMDRFRWTFDSAASMVFHTKTGLPLTSSPAPLRRGNNCFDFDDSINGISGIKSALFHPISPVSAAPSPASPPRPKREGKLKIGPSSGLLGSFEESALQGRLEAVATVCGFTAELGASGAFCPPHRRLPVTVFFYAPGGTNAPYMGHINLGPHGYRVARSGTIQVSLFNPHGTLVKMFVVLYDLTRMPPLARTFLRQRTLYMPAGVETPQPHHMHKWLRYLIHLRFMTSKSGKLYLHTDIRLIVSRKADLDTATAHSALFRPITDSNKTDSDSKKVDSKKTDSNDEETSKNRPNRVFGGSSEHCAEKLGYDSENGVPYELRSFTYAPENPKFSPR